MRRAGHFGADIVFAAAWTPLLIAGDGQVTGGPATTPLVSVPVRVVDGQVTTA